MNVIEGFLIGMLVGEAITGTIVLCFLHKRWYGSFIPKRKNFPFSKKLKKHLNLNDDYIIVR